MLAGLRRISLTSTKIVVDNHARDLPQETDRRRTGDSACAVGAWTEHGARRRGRNGPRGLVYHGAETAADHGGEGARPPRGGGTDARVRSGGDGRRHGAATDRR